MKLHTNVTEGTTGLIFKKKTWKMAARVELSPDEEVKYKAHPDIAKLPMATGTFIRNYPLECSVGMLVKGMNDSAFDNLANQTAFEQALHEGCARLKTHFVRLGQVESGPSTVEF